MKPLINFKTIITTLFYFSLTFLHLQAYDPIVRFTLNCGTTQNSTDGERTWIGDTNSKLLSFQNNPTIVSNSTITQQQQSSINKIPYSTARVSYSQFNYSFPVTTGPYFLRLFFYPSTYTNGFNRYHASFTVISNGFTLLKDFNASLNADFERVDTLFKEYVIYVDENQRLELSFIPSGGNSNNYAFINGIEVLSMPNDLYYINDPEFSLVGTPNTPYNIPTSVALQTDYRIRVGIGQTISPKHDTGMFRNWKNNDEDYLKTPTSRDFGDADTTGTKNITVIPDYVAPIDLYRTSRDLGTNATLNKLLNLTWEFPVDSGFHYMIRLHFCEINPNITTVSQRAFIIYLQGQVAQDNADVMKWAQNKKGLAIQRNYAVSVPKSDSNKKQKLSLQLHPFDTSVFTIHSDPFLNGLEIFKINDISLKSLAGPNPDPIQDSNKGQKIESKKSISETTIIGVVFGVVFGVVLLSFIVFFIFRRKKEMKEKKTTIPPNKSKSSTTSKWGPLSFSTTKSTNTQNSSLPSDLCRNFSLLEIRSATNNFDELFIVGVGGFGHVYKGYIDNGSTPVAIKRLKPGSQQGENEFINEIDMLSKLRHLHLVSLIGYCNENNEMIIVYDFMARGTLRDHLYNTENPALSWKQRLQISIGAARGLHYLHTGAKHTIIHRDVKTTNILLDEKWVAKVSDFGLSRIGPTGMSKAHVSTVVKGSVGYLDPEYYKRQRLTEKSDVYSFGVVLFEILCARPPLIRTAEKKQVSLPDWAKYCYKSGTLGSIVDPSIKWSIAPECLKKFVEIAVSCLLDDGTERPSMNDVVWMLEFALQLQESAEQRERVVVGIDDVAGERKNENENDDVFSTRSDMGLVSDFNMSSELSVSNTTASTTTGDHSYGYNKESVFSEIIDPKAR